MAAQDTSFHRKTTLNCAGRLVDLSTPRVMGILNVTPDSFYDGGMYDTTAKAIDHLSLMLDDGATFIDIGGASSRPGAAKVSLEQEIERVIPVITEAIEQFPDILISVDTTRSHVAREAVNAGAVMINDISAGQEDEDMIDTVAELGVPYVCMHMQGDPSNMQNDPRYENVVFEVTKFFSERVELLKEAGIKDIILDPGFGFGKSLEHNYSLIHHLDHFGMLELPVLAGLSRKSMIYKTLNIKPKDSVNGSTALHMACLERGASILRVHDVKEAIECVRLFESIRRNKIDGD